MADFSEEQIAELREAFSMFDRSGDGLISADELKAVMQTLGQNPTNLEILEMIKSVDANEDGTIDFLEFLTLMRQRIKEFDNEEALMEAFRIFDKDGNGYITANELKHVMVSLGEQLAAEDVDDMIEHADLDGDGMISFDEFVKTLSFRQ